MYTFSDLIRIIRPYQKNTSISDEKLIDDFLTPIVVAADLTNKAEETFYLDKSRVSHLMNHVEDIPAALRNALSLLDIESAVSREMKIFIAGNINQNRLDDSRNAIISIITDSENISESDKKDISNMANTTEEVYTKALLLALKLNNRYPKNRIVVFEQGVNTADVIAGDLFKYACNNRKGSRNIIVIPVNTSFDTIVTTNSENHKDIIVSANTLHGAWLDRWTQSGHTIDELNRRIDESLDVHNQYPSGRNERKIGKNIEYPIGTIAVIQEENVIYYLLAISTFNTDFRAESNADNIYTAIEKLIRFYDVNGQGCPLYIPLMGTGKSRAGLAYQDSYRLITKAIMENKKYVQGQIHLTIQNNVFQQLSEKGELP